MEQQGAAASALPLPLPLTLTLTLPIPIPIPYPHPNPNPNKGVKFREHTFLANRLVPAALRDNRVRVSVVCHTGLEPRTTMPETGLCYSHV